MEHDQGGGSSLHRPEVQRDIGLRLARLTGQLEGVRRMVEEQAYCMDVLQQIRAVEGGLRKVSLRLLEAHVQHCVYAAASAGSEQQRRDKIDELVRLLEKGLK